MMGHARHGGIPMTRLRLALAALLVCCCLGAGSPRGTREAASPDPLAGSWEFVEGEAPGKNEILVDGDYTFGLKDFGADFGVEESRRVCGTYRADWSRT